MCIEGQWGEGWEACLQAQYELQGGMFTPETDLKDKLHELTEASLLYIR